MTEKPLVSVIIPCYNQGQYIDETLKSVFTQTYDNIETIIVDDGSTDEVTINRITELSKDSRLKVFQISNAGVSAARNFAISKSSGVYILPLDADDIISDTYIEKAIKILTKSKEIDLVYCRASYFGERVGEIELGKYDISIMLTRNQIFNSAVMLKEKILKISGYDESFKTGWEDWEFYLRYVQNSSQVYMIDDILFHYRIKADSRNESLQSEKLEFVENQLYLKHIELYLKYFNFPITRLRNYESDQKKASALESTIAKIRSSISFKIGSYITWPFRNIYYIIRNGRN